MLKHPEIIRRLQQADRVAQQERGANRLLRLVPWALALPVACFAADVVWHLGPWLRLLLLAVSALAVLGAVGFCAYTALIRRNRLEHTARLIEAHDPALGSRLINFLQLREQAGDSALPPLTRELAGGAVEDYAQRLGDLDFASRARSGLLPRAWKIALAGAAVFLLVLGGAYRVTLVELARFADPFGDHPPFSFTRLEIAEPDADGFQVIYNRSLVVRAIASGHRPEELFLTFHPPEQPGLAITVPMFDKGELGFDQKVEGIKTDLVVFAHTKNRHSVSKQRRITVQLTPQLEQAVLALTPPAYTGLPATEKVWDFKNFRALAGTRVEVRLQSNRPLKSGEVELSHATDRSERLTMSPTAENAVAVAFIAAESGQLKFALTDIDGIASDQPWEGSMTVTFDLGPEVQIASPDKDTFAAIDHPLDVRIEASDDYGVAKLRLHRGINGVFQEPKIVTYEGVQRAVQETLHFDFITMGASPGDVISVFAEAIDTAPEPHLARSQTIRLIVISVEDYNDFLRQQRDLEDLSGKYAELIDRLQEKLDEQRKLADKAAELQAQQAKATTPEQQEALARELDQLLARQSDLNQQFDKLAAQMENFVRKDPLYDFEKDLQERLQQFAERLRESSEANDQAMRELAQQSMAANRPPTPGMFGDFEQAAREQLERLGAVQQAAEDQLMEPLEDLAKLQEIMKDFNRFETLYQTQKKLTGQLAAYNREGRLSREDQLALKETAATERKIADELRLLAEKLGEDADAAEELFPKAAQSARDLAEAIAQQRMPPLADSATQAMLAGAGDRSFQLSSRLEAEMEKLFGQCQSQGGSNMQSELDQYLRLSRSMNPGQSFQQMMQCMKMGYGTGSGLGFGLGEAGMAGQSGQAVRTGMNFNVMGGETLASKSSASERGNKPGAADAAGPALGDALQLDRADVLEGLSAVQRQADAIASESTFEAYREVVDEYFKAITREN